MAILEEDTLIENIVFPDPETGKLLDDEGMEVLCNCGSTLNYYLKVSNRKPDGMCEKCRSVITDYGRFISIQVN